MNQLNQAKTALVLGFTGGVGFEVTKALLADNYHVTALIRNSEQLKKLTHPNLRYEIGDAQNQTCVDRLTQNQDIVFYGINYQYADWSTLAMQTFKIAANACVKSGSRFILPGNIYGLAGTNETQAINEHTANHALFELGKIRIIMEGTLAQFHKQAGLKYLIVRAGNYIGKDAPSTWLSFLISQNRQTKQVTLTSLGDSKKTISWCYLPDLAQNLVHILKSDTENKLNHLKGNDVFCFEGYQYSFDDLAQILKSLTKQSVKRKKLPFAMISFLSIFIPKLKMTTTTRTLFEKSLLLDQTKAANLFESQHKSLKHTKIEDALVEAQLIQL